MGKASLHKVSMYINEAFAIALLIAWLSLRQIELLLFFLAFLVISATFHITYLLSLVYELLEEMTKKSEKEGKGG